MYIIFDKFTTPVNRKLHHKVLVNDMAQDVQISYW